MDDIARFNKERWEALAKANIAYSRPALDLDRQSARQMVDPYGVIGEVAGREVLCLAAGGGQQTACFALLGAHVTVFDLSETQLQRDRQTADHYGLDIATVQGDMRNLSCFDDDSFDLVWQAHAINFVPDAQSVLREVARVIRHEGRYRLEFSNPFVMAADNEDWDGRGYPIKKPYVDGAEMVWEDPYWKVEAENGTCQRILGPREYMHALGTMINGLVRMGFVILGVWEEAGGDVNAAPGTWEHFKSFCPPWLTVWSRYLAEVYSCSDADER